MDDDVGAGLTGIVPHLDGSPPTTCASDDDTEIQALYATEDIAVPESIVV